MATTTKSTKVAGKTSRYNELKTMLEERRRELMTAVQHKMRDVRAEGGNDRDVLDQGESSEVDIQEDIEFALIQMKSETLNKIDAARLHSSSTCFNHRRSGQNGCSSLTSRPRPRDAGLKSGRDKWV